ncbi:MAG: DUF4254 domain-containing protein [Gammaproteobacteria bacterium]|nr:DUF4254 domain-containing protein [Gammaproteobacteria bacterium]MCH9764265.1 DUF4254 domain-containing protein [Gammaproteobacteria bacterium]
MGKIINVSEITILHREAIITWKAYEILLHASNASDFLGLVEQNHAFNYRLWHAEDKARREDMGHTFVYQAKREIDGHNQKRNDCMEAMDDYLIELLKPAAPDMCVVHSETPGMMIDRLSILALKQYHMTEQTVRQDVDDVHRAECLEKLGVIDAQIIQLSTCLSDLLQEVLQQTRTFRVYRQFKMYNSVQLNPELYANET